MVNSKLLRPGWRQKATLLAGLYTSQTLGMAFVLTAVPVILRRSGAGLDILSLLFVLGLFWSLKFLWAPLIDRYRSKRLGHFRGWIIILQLLMIASAICASFFPPEEQLACLLPLLCLLTFFSATQDIAADGLAVTILAPEERNAGSSIQSAGNMIGFMLGGGVVLLAYARLQWSGTLLLLAGGMALPLINILRYKESPSTAGNKKNKISYAALMRFFRKPGMRRWIPVLLIFRINHQITYWLLNPFLVDLGWSMNRIGIALNIVGLLFGVAGSVLGGAMGNHWGKKTTMMAAMGFGVLGTGGLLLLTQHIAAPVSLTVYAIIALIMITYGLNSTVMYAAIMDKCDPSRAATDFTLQWSLSSISAMLGGGMAMALAEFIGYAGVLLISIGSALLSLFLIWRCDGFASAPLAPGHPNKEADAVRHGC